MKCSKGEYTSEGVYHFLAAAFVCVVLFFIITYAIPVEIAYFSLNNLEPSQIEAMHTTVLYGTIGAAVTLSLMVGVHKYLKGKRKCGVCTKTTNIEAVVVSPSTSELRSRMESTTPKHQSGQKNISDISAPEKSEDTGMA